MGSLGKSQPQNSPRSTRSGLDTPTWPRKPVSTAVTPLKATDKVVQPRPKKVKRPPVAWNLNNPPIKLRHSSLSRVSDIYWRRQCPKCKKGTVLVRRHPQTFQLVAWDNCVLCGQQYLYTDIKRMQARDQGK